MELLPWIECYRRRLIDVPMACIGTSSIFFLSEKKVIPHPCLTQKKILNTFMPTFTLPTFRSAIKERKSFALRESFLYFIHYSILQNVVAVSGVSFKGYKVKSMWLYKVILDVKNVQLFPHSRVQRVDTGADLLR